MARLFSDQYKAEVSKIVSQDINAEGLIHDYRYEKTEHVMGVSRRTLVVHFSHYEKAQEATTMEYTVKLQFVAEEGVTADQVKDTIESGDCGDLDKIIDTITKLKVKVVPEVATLSDE